MHTETKGTLTGLSETNAAEFVIFKIQQKTQDSGGSADGVDYFFDNGGSAAWTVRSTDDDLYTPSRSVMAFLAQALNQGTEWSVFSPPKDADGHSGQAATALGLHQRSTEDGQDSIADEDFVFAAASPVQFGDGKTGVAPTSEIGRPEVIIVDDGAVLKGGVSAWPAKWSGPTLRDEGDAPVSWTDDFLF